MPRMSLVIVAFRHLHQRFTRCNAACLILLYRFQRPPLHPESITRNRQPSLYRLSPYAQLAIDTGVLDIHCCVTSWGGVSAAQANYIADVLGWTVQQKILSMQAKGFVVGGRPSTGDVASGGGAELGDNALFIIFTILGSIVILAAGAWVVITLHRNAAKAGKEAVATGESAA